MLKYHLDIQNFTPIDRSTVMVGLINMLGRERVNLDGTVLYFDYNENEYRIANFLSRLSLLDSVKRT